VKLRQNSHCYTKSINQWVHVHICKLIVFCFLTESVHFSKSKWWRWSGGCGVLSPNGTLMVRAQWCNHSAFTAKILFSTFPDLAGSFIVASKFTSFHLRFCDTAWLLLWSIDKKCWGRGVLLRSLCLTLQFVCVSLCKSAYTQLVEANALLLTASKPHGSTV